MKYICFGYLDMAAWDARSETERRKIMDGSLAYHDELRAQGHYLGGAPFALAQAAVTLRLRGGEVAITDGPYAETNEQLGGILVIDARDLNHAVALMSKHPGLRAGRFEIRPASDPGQTQT